MTFGGRGKKDRRQAAWRLFAVVGLVAAFAFPQAVIAAEEAGKPSANAVTGTAGAWSAEVSKEPGVETAVPEDQRAVIEKINAYMQTFNDLEGRFIQTNPDNAVQKGTFYVLRPGKMRFDYARPSKMRIVSDGTYLSIEDHDLKTVNKYPLEQTPFRMLLKENVSLEKDAHIISLSNSDTGTAITLADKSGQSAGRIQLFFSQPEMALKEWVITDAQGLHTRIEVSNLTFEKKLASTKLFEPTRIGLENIFKND